MKTPAMFGNPFSKSEWSKTLEARPELRAGNFFTAA